MCNVRMDFIEIVDTNLKLEEISDLVKKSNCGAVSIFVGTTRETFEDKKVIHLEYEAYKPMAVKAIKKICEEIRIKWNVENIAVYHRIGIVPVKEASVVIAISSVHRNESIQAVQYAIDNLKSSVPIWKKEVYEVASAEWKENKESAHHIPEFMLEEHSYIKTEDKQTYIMEEEPVPSHLIQIKVNANEIQRRIDTFIKRKREAIDIANIRDFCQGNGQSMKENSCARVDAVLIRRKDSKSHLRVRRVLNKWGPQTRGLDPGSVDNPNVLGSVTEDNPNVGNTQCHYGGDIYLGTEERLQNAEKYLHITNGPVSKDVYARLKQIEDKILYLESISPEYSTWGQAEEKPNQKEILRSRKKIYSANDVEKRINDLQRKIGKEELH